MSGKSGRKSLSPWVWAGVGCATLGLLGGVGCAALFFGVKSMIETPIDPKKSLAALQDAKIPVYPGATVNPMLTRLHGKAFSTLTALSGGKARVTAVSFDVPEPVIVVRRWYGKTLLELGFKEESSQESSVAGSRVDQVQWGRTKGETLMVQFTTPEPGKKGSVVALIRITGLPKESRN
jgi:hypothetical protein